MSTNEPIRNHPLVSSLVSLLTLTFILALNEDISKENHMLVLFHLLTYCLKYK